MEFTNMSDHPSPDVVLDHPIHMIEQRVGRIDRQDRNLSNFFLEIGTGYSMP
jgi:hypothetical protein